MRWTLLTIIVESKKYTSRVDFKKGCRAAYIKACNLGIMDELFTEHKSRKWTDQEIIEMAALYKQANDFRVHHDGMYQAALKKGLIKTLFPISNVYKCMGRMPYTVEELSEAAKQHPTRKAWKEANSGQYQVAQRKGIVDKAGPAKIHGESSGELELLAWLQSLVSDFKSTRFGKQYEIDCYSEKLKLGIEFNGLYWHSDSQKERLYHLNKTKHFEALGVRVIHIWENEWRDRKDQVKNYLMSACGVNGTRIGARKCIFKEIDKGLARSFLNKNHIQGAPVNIQLAIGSIYNNELISVATFGPHHRQGKNDVILNRFACEPGFTVTGSLAKVSKMAFEALGPLKSWADYSKSQARGYIAAGWKKESLLNPDYFYTDKKGKTVSKQSRKKSKVGTPEGITEGEHAAADGLYRIWDCGKIVLSYGK